MLLELNIENFAIIDKINISFSKGLNVLTGETGAGKSIIIDAVGTVLGGRSTREYVRTGYDKAVIEAVFHINNPEAFKSTLEKYGIDSEPDNTILITRDIYASGKSTSRVNGRTVTLTMLKDITDKLVDIHGQHEHQSLLSWENHVDFIDSLGGEKIKIIKKSLSDKYDEIQKYKKRLKELSYDERERHRQIDLLKFQLEEIDEANLKANDEESLMDQYNILSNTEEIITVLANVLDTLNSNNYNKTSTIDSLTNVSVQLNKLSKHDSRLNAYNSLIESAIYQLQDASRELRGYQDNIELEYDPEKIKELEDRIDLVNRLKRKYGSSIEEILKYKEEISSELEYIINSEEEVLKIQKEIELLENKIFLICEDLSKERKYISKNIENDITNELHDLNMSNVTFKVDYERLDYFNRNGIDKIEFMIATNLGEPVKPLSRIVSGGEMSRIMLAFKTILADVDEIPSLVFDEIDTGISGRTAQTVGEKISKISKTHQVFCITHLPQIAALSDNHYLISKVFEQDKTVTQITKLDENERVDELSRLLGGVDLTNTTKLHAKEMIEMSKRIKAQL